MAPKLIFYIKVYVSVCVKYLSAENQEEFFLKTPKLLCFHSVFLVTTPRFYVSMFTNINRMQIFLRSRCLKQRLYTV